MDHLPGRMQRIWEAMESCRVSAGDLGSPEFADLAAQLARDPELQEKFEQLQHADAMIKAAFRNVPIPADLSSRVSYSVLQASSSKVVAPAAAPQSPMTILSADGLSNSDSPTPLRSHPERLSRRRLLAGFAALALATGLLAAVWIQTHRPQHETPTSVLDEAMDLFGKEKQPLGELVSRVAPPARYPMSLDIVRLPEVRWRRVEGFLGGSAVAYDLSINGGRATLYVVDRIVDGLPACPPEKPFGTGGRSAAAWQAGETLYVFVVEGDAGTYSRYLDQSHGPLT